MAPRCSASPGPGKNPRGQADEYWKVTTVDGTQYYFGRGKRTASGAALNSAWTVPVFGNHPAERCYSAPEDGGFEDSRCSQVWRWKNLDYVVDTSNNSMTYFYKTETNHYVVDFWNNYDADTASYIAGGRLDRIEYGTVGTAEEGACWRSHLRHDATLSDQPQRLQLILQRGSDRYR